MIKAITLRVKIIKNGDMLIIIIIIIMIMIINIIIIKIIKIIIYT